MTLRAVNEMLLDEDAASVVREGSLAAWPGMSEMRFNQSFSLAQEATSLELHGMSSPVFR